MNNDINVDLLSMLMVSKCKQMEGVLRSYGSGSGNCGFNNVLKASIGATIKETRRCVATKVNDQQTSRRDKE
jgi:hypothetical protein